MRELYGLRMLGTAGVTIGVVLAVYAMTLTAIPLVLAFGATAIAFVYYGTDLKAMADMAILDKMEEESRA